MARYAYVLLKHDGVVERVHALGWQIGGGGEAGTPTTNPIHLEELLQSNFVAIREVPLPGADSAAGLALGCKVLLVLKDDA